LIVPFGFYGWGNIGDEATLQGFAHLVGVRRPRPSAWIASRNPAHTARVEPSFRYYAAEGRDLRARWAQYRSNAVAFAGGTPIMDGLGEWPLAVVAPLVEAAAQRGHRVAFVGIGTESLQRAASRDLIAIRLAPHVQQWTVRSVHDRERLTLWGVSPDRVMVAADMAWLLSPATTAFGRGQLDALHMRGDAPIVGVNVNNEAVILEREPRFFETLASFLDDLIETRGARVLFFCSEVRPDPEYDHAAAQRVQAAMRHGGATTIFPNRYWSPQQLKSLIACCQLVLSTRYHVCLFSALQQVPFIALQRSDKVRDLCTDIEWPHGLTLGHIRSATLHEHADGIARNAEALRARLLKAAEDRRRESQRNQVALDALGDDARPAPSEDVRRASR
jgi:polysaccharide pyruvyl transferase WcaK-like protein